MAGLMTVWIKAGQDDSDSSEKVGFCGNKVQCGIFIDDTTKIEKASWKTSVHRNRPTWWHTLGHDIGPKFALNMSSVRHQAWNIRKGQQCMTRWKEAVIGLGWHVTEQTNIVETPDGLLDFCWDGESTNNDAVKRAWSRKLWATDKRSPIFDTGCQ